MKLYRQYLSEDDEFEDEFDTRSLRYDEIKATLKSISQKLAVSGRINPDDSNEFIFSISARVILRVTFYDKIKDIRVEIRPASRDTRQVFFKCLEETTELSNLSDYINTAVLVAKDIQDKLM